MRCAVCANGDTGMCSGNKDIKVAVADGDAQLIEIARG